MTKQVELPEGLVEFIRAWCDGHKQRDPEAWAWTDYETWQRDDMIASALDAFPALREAIYKHFSDRLLSGEVVKGLTKEIVEGSDGEVISLPYRVVEDALRERLAALQAASIPACELCDDTGWLCAECQKPRPRCSCGLDGASEDGCPDCAYRALHGATTTPQDKEGR